jgi:hypothetical protein
LCASPARASLWTLKSKVGNAERGKLCCSRHVAHLRLTCVASALLSLQKMLVLFSDGPGSESGYFGPWQLCKYLLYGRERCGPSVTRFKPVGKCKYSVDVVVAPAFTAVCCQFDSNGNCDVAVIPVNSSTRPNSRFLSRLRLSSLFYENGVAKMNIRKTKTSACRFVWVFSSGFHINGKRRSGGV